MHTSSIWIGTIASILLATVGCASDGAGIGTAPEITNLSYSPTTVTVGVAQTVTGTFSFRDPDGDVLELHGQIRSPDGSVSSFPASRVGGVAAVTEGVLGFSVVLVLPTPEIHELAMWVRDGGGNDSNQLVGTLDAR